MLVTGIILSVVAGLSLSGASEPAGKAKSFWTLIISVAGGLCATVIFSFCVYALGELCELMKLHYNLLRRMAKAGRVIISSEVNKY
jgi:hypothetical protein